MIKYFITGVLLLVLSVCAQAKPKVVIVSDPSRCTPCAQMDSSVFSRGDVKKALSRYNVIKVRSGYGVSGIPTIIIYNGNGHEVQRFVGYTPASTLIQALNVNGRQAAGGSGYWSMNPTLSGYMHYMKTKRTPFVQETCGVPKEFRKHHVKKHYIAKKPHKRHRFHPIKGVKKHIHHKKHNKPIVKHEKHSTKVYSTTIVKTDVHNTTIRDSGIANDQPKTWWETVKYYFDWPHRLYVRIKTGITAFVYPRGSP